MSPSWPNVGATTYSHEDFDDAEKGLYDSSTASLPVIPPVAHGNHKRAMHIETRKSLHIDTFLSPMSPIHEGLTPFSSVTALQLSLSWPAGWKDPNPPRSDYAVRKPDAPKEKISAWILFVLWFNTYRKFFTFVTLLNLTGIILTAVGRFPYAENHLGALVLGNLLCAILMRNELFLRFLYIIAIYGLRSVRFFLYHPRYGL